MKEHSAYWPRRVSNFSVGLSGTMVSFGEISVIAGAVNKDLWKTCQMVYSRRKGLRSTMHGKANDLRIMNIGVVNHPAPPRRQCASVIDCIKLQNFYEEPEGDHRRQVRGT